MITLSKRCSHSSWMTFKILIPVEAVRVSLVFLNRGATLANIKQAIKENQFV